MARYRLLVFTKPAPGREDEYNAWYEEHHLDEGLALDAFTAVQRFRFAPEGQPPRPRFSESDPPLPYLALWEIETDDIEAHWAELEKALDTGHFTGGPMSSSGIGVSQMWLFDEVSPRRESPS
jgi:hypothetical protein